MAPMATVALMVMTPLAGGGLGRQPQQQHREDGKVRAGHRGSSPVEDERKGCVWSEIVAVLFYVRERLTGQLRNG